MALICQIFSLCARKGTERRSSNADTRRFSARLARAPFDTAHQKRSETRGPIVSGTGCSGNSEVLAKSKRTHPTGV